MKKQIEGQINLFDYISIEDKKVSDSNLINDVNENMIDYSEDKSLMISLFTECADCWCSTCRHNADGKAIPRDFAGVKKPCPSCSFCLSQGKAEICEIDSYENGCKLRAEEEGIIE